MGPDAMIFLFWMLSFKPTFSLSSFTFIKRLFSSSSLSAIRVVSSAYLYISSVQFSRHLLEFTQTHVHRVGDAIQSFHPLSSPSPPAPNLSQYQSLFQWVITNKQSILGLKRMSYLRHTCHPAISSSIIPLSSCPQSLPAFHMVSITWHQNHPGDHKKRQISLTKLETNVISVILANWIQQCI